MELTRDEVVAAAELIRPYVRRTPVIDVEAGTLAEPEPHPEPHPEPQPQPEPEPQPQPQITLKLELMQVAGSFKARGAFTNLLVRDVPEAGVVAASGGNHGVAVAYAAHRRGIPAKIFVPTVSAPAKMARIRELGAELVVGGDRYADAYESARDWASTSGALKIHAFDQRETILGQATLALELSQQATLDTVLVPVGGGGLIAGVASYLKTDVKVIGVEPDGAPTLHNARAHGAPVDAPAGSIAADALAPKRIGDIVFPITQKYVDDVVLVTDDQIRAAQRTLWQALRLATEPAGAVGVAALQCGAYRPAPGERVGVVISGTNTATLPD